MREILQNIPIPKGSKGLYKKGHIEKDFESEVFKYLRIHEYLCYHVADIGFGYRYLDGIIDCPDGSSFRIEFKKIDGYTFNMKQFEDSQIEILEYFKHHGNEAYIMIYSQKTKTYITTTYDYLKSQANSVGGIKIFSQGK